MAQALSNNNVGVRERGTGEGLPRIVDIAPQSRGGFGLDENGKVHYFGTAGVNVIDTDIVFAALSGGENFAIGLDQEGHVWQLKGEGKVGVQVLGAQDINKIRAGSSHALLLNKRGEVLCMGFDNWGQRGGDTKTPFWQTNRLKLEEKVEAICAGKWQSYCQLQNDQILGWGWNTFPEFDDDRIVYVGQVGRLDKPLLRKNPGKMVTRVLFNDSGGFFPGLSLMEKLVRISSPDILSL